MPIKKTIRVKRYRRYKNGKWENITEHLRNVSSNTLTKRIAEDLEKGFS